MANERLTNMKRIIFLLILSVITVNFSTINGQSKYYRRSLPKFGYGVKAGINVAGQSSTATGEEIDVKKVLGVNAGGYCNYFVNNYIGFQAEILVSGKGSHWKDYYDDRKDILTYVDFPVLVKYQPVRYFNVHAGAIIGFMVSAKQKDLETGIKYDIREIYEPIDYSLVGGIEGTLPNKINITLRYVYGMSAATNDLVYVEPWKNNFIQFSVGYRFKGR